MTKAREKAIKLYWKIAKERCPFQEEEIVLGFLEGFIECAEYLLLQNTELEKENAGLKKRNIEDCKKFNRAVEKIGEQLNQKQYQLTKAKEIIKKYLAIGVGGKITQNYLDVTKEAEQFLNEV